MTLFSVTLPDISLGAANDGVELAIHKAATTAGQYFMVVTRLLLSTLLTHKSRHSTSLVHKTSTVIFARTLTNKAVLIESGGKIGNGKLVEEGKKAVKENSDKLATMFPTDTPNDIANNHKGAELAQGANSWDELLNKVANSAAKAPSNDGRGQ